MLQPPNPPSSSRRLALALVGVVLVGAAGLRAAQLGESLWLDELHTAWVVANGWRDVAPRALLGNQGPLYYYALRAAVALGGLNEPTLRSLSLAAGLALVAALAWAARRGTGLAGTAVAVSLLASLDPVCVFYSQEARPYAWVQLAALAHLVLLAALVEAPTARRRVAWVLGAGLLFHLHYTAWLLLAAEAAYYAAARAAAGKPLPYGPRALLADGLAAGLLALPAAPHVAEVARRREQWAQFVRPWPSPAMRNALWAYVLIPWLAALALAAGRRAAGRRAWRRVDRRWLALAGCWTFAPPAVAWLATAIGVAPLFHLRYCVASYAGAMLLAGLAAASRPARLERGLVAAASLAAVLGTSGYAARLLADGRLLADRDENWRAAVCWINAADPEGRLPVLVRSGLLESDAWADSTDPLRRRYCLLPVLGIYRLVQREDNLVPLASTKPPRLAERVRRRIAAERGAWLMVRGGPDAARRLVREAATGLARDGLRVRAAAARSFGRVSVVRLAAAGGPPAG